MYQKCILPNGLKIIHNRTDGCAASCGVILNVGSRDEREGEYGIAHFIEHVIFKGTNRRKAYHILSRMEDVGGELNAFTTKEDTCIYSNFLAKDYGRALELLSDIVFGSVFPDKEILKEKEVVADEINSYKDLPGDSIFDEFEEMVYEGYPMGRNILGTEEQVRAISREAIMDFVGKYYIPRNIVIASVGNIDFDELVVLADKYFGSVPGGIFQSRRIKPVDYKPVYREVEKNTNQVYCVMGNLAYDYTDEKRLPLSILTGLLGGATMNSRLNLSIREKYGLVYSIEAGYTPYSDTGIFSVYFDCDPGDFNRCFSLCNKELKRMCEQPLRKLQLQKILKQTVNQMLIGFENKENLMLSIGKSYLIYDEVDEPEEVFEKIYNIDAATMSEVAQEVFSIDDMSVIVYK